MADRVIALGAKVTPSTIRGQGCLASVIDPDESWIFEAVTGVDEAAAGVGEDTDYPVGFSSVDHLMELYWRWKEMRIDWAYSYTSPTGSVSKTETDDREVSPPSGTVTVSRESELILSAPWIIEGEDRGDFSSPFPAAYWEGAASIFIPASNTHRVRFYDDKYYPAINIDVTDHELADAMLGLYSPIAQIVSTGLTGGQAFDGKLIMSDATEYDIPLAIFHSHTGSGTPTFEIDATEYWPHEKAGGGPKYNTSTGAKL